MQQDMPIGFLNPGQVLDHVDLKEGAAVADFGCGGGHFTFEAARRVGDTGSVWALDVLPSALEAVESTADIEGLKHITCKRVNLEEKQGSGLEDATIDVVIAKDIFFQNKDKVRIVHEAHRVLKKNGILFVIEWGEKKEHMGPDAALRIMSKDLERLVEEFAFRVEKTISIGNYHYAVVAKKIES